MTGRVLFPKMVTDMGLLGEGAEIGVFDGEHADLLLGNWPGKLLYAIDPFFDELIDIKKIKTLPPPRKNEQKRCHDRLARYGDRVKFLELTSEEASKTMADGNLDWAYIDACHSYESVTEDIRLWLPKVRKGGVLAGHDYWNHKRCRAKKAVDDFFGDRVKVVCDITWYVLV
jgi:hypothetical protein